MAKRLCTNCKFQYMCRAERAFYELTQTLEWDLTFGTTNIKMIKEQEIRSILADACVYYMERTE